jgi:hypothetical protein
MESTDLESDRVQCRSQTDSGEGKIHYFLVCEAQEGDTQFNRRNEGDGSNNRRDLSMQRARNLRLVTQGKGVEVGDEMFRQFDLREFRKIE